MNYKILATDRNVSDFVELLVRSKAVWHEPELLSLTRSATSPKVAYKLVLRKTGKRNLAEAAKLYAVACRDHMPIMVRATLRYFKAVGHNRPEKLKEFLNETLRTEQD